MTIYVHRPANFKKNLENLSKGDKTASQAAERAEEILFRLSSGGSGALVVHNRLTKNGELRIEGCRKYDLGGGYRLVCVKRGGKLIATCVGSHDDCDRWIENNRGFDPTSHLQCYSLPVSEDHRPDRVEYSGNESTEPDYDEIFLTSIDDRILRHVFSGLCDG